MNRVIRLLPVVSLCAVALCLGLTGCGNGTSSTSSGDPNTIKIVSSLPRTGSAKGQTDTIVNGIKMAFDEVGYQVGDFKIVYEDLDDATAAQGAWTAEREAANADQAVKDADTMIYIGPYNSGAAKVSIPILNKAGILMISPAVTWPGMTKPGKGDPGEPGIYQPSGTPNFTRVVPADDIQAAFGAKWAKKLGVTKVVVLDDNETYGKGIATLFKENCRELGIKVIGGQQSIDPLQPNFRNLMAQIAGGEKPDLIYFGGTSQSKAPTIAKDILAAGLRDVKFMVPDGCFELTFIQQAGAETFKTLPTYVTFGGDPPDRATGKTKEFAEKYLAKYGKQPEGYAIYGYEAGKVAIEAIKKAGQKDRAAILAAAFGIEDFDGATGKWSFDKNGDTTARSMTGNTIENGAFKYAIQLSDLETE